MTALFAIFVNNDFLAGKLVSIYYIFSCENLEKEKEEDEKSISKNKNLNSNRYLEIINREQK